MTYDANNHSLSNFAFQTSPIKRKSQSPFQKTEVNDEIKQYLDQSLFDDRDFFDY